MTLSNHFIISHPVQIEPDLVKFERYMQQNIQIFLLMQERR